jgi:hypothetical protein
MTDSAISLNTIRAVSMDMFWQESSWYWPRERDLDNGDIFENNFFLRKRR